MLYCQLDHQLFGQDEREVLYISKENIPVKTLEGSPLDFFRFGYF